MKRMTVTFCGYDKINVAGGPAIWLTRFPSVLREHGVDVRVRLFSWDDTQRGIVLKSLKEQGIDVSSQQFSDTHTNIRYLINDLSWSSPDVFVPNLVTPAFFAGRWARSAGIPTIGVLHSDDAFYRSIQEEFIFGHPMYAMSGVVCVSEELMQQVSRRKPKNTVQARIPYGVPTPDLMATRIPGRLRIGFVGRLAEEQKRISEVTHAFCRVTQELEGVEAIIYGDGPDSHQVQQILATAGDSVRVRMAGAVSSEEIQARLVDECDTIVLLSDYEGLPISLLEAMACGLVPVCLRIRSGVPELVQNGVTGLLVGNRQQSFTDAIRQLRDNPDLWKRMSAAASQQVRKDNSLDAAAERWVALFQKLQHSSTGTKPISLPQRYKLPSVNPGLLDQDRRVARPGLRQHTHRLRQVFRGLKSK
jgi:glycosyltransferase involved in cell wall biosynthesis